MPFSRDFNACAVFHFENIMDFAHQRQTLDTTAQLANSGTDLSARRRVVAALRCLCLGLQLTMTTATLLTTDDIWHACRKAGPDRFGAQAAAHTAALTAVCSYASPSDRPNNVAYDLDCKGLIALGKQVAPDPEALKAISNFPITHAAYTNDNLACNHSEATQRQGLQCQTQDPLSSPTWPTAGHQFFFTNKAGTRNVLANCLIPFGQTLTPPTTHTTPGSTTTPSASSFGEHWDSGTFPLELPTPLPQRLQTRASFAAGSSMRPPSHRMPALARAENRSTMRRIRATGGQVNKETTIPALARQGPDGQ